MTTTPPAAEPRDIDVEAASLREHGFDWVIEAFAERDALIAEYEGRIARYERFLLKSPTFGPLRETPAGDGAPSCIEMPVEHPSTSVLLAGMVAALDEAKAINYVAIGGWHPSVGRVEMIIQRVGKVTPHQGRCDAEAALKRAVDQLRALGGTWDEPLTYIPDRPADAHLARGQKHPWLVLDLRTDPNTMRCQRCGAEQQLPSYATSEVLTAANKAFEELHVGCEEGDKL